MDPVSIVSVASAAGSLAFKCATIVQTLHCLSEKYKKAELTILSFIQDCRTVELAWSRIERWAANSLDMFDDHEELAERLQLSIYAGQLFMAELEKDLASLEDTPKYSTLRRRTKIVWNESMLREHQDRIQRQVCALTLLLEVIQLPSRPDRDRALSIEEPVFRSVEESVRSIVPTNLSLCSNDASSIRSFESSELFYAPFSFENDLFTSYVYKRNFRVTGLHIKQVQKTPEVRHFSGPIETSIPQTVETSKGTALSQNIELDTNWDSFASASPGSRDTTSADQEHTRDLISAKKSIEDLHRRPSDMEIVLDHEESAHEWSVSVVDPDTVDTTQSIANNHVHTSNVCFDTVPLEAVHTDLGIKRKPLPSSAKFLEGPTTVHRLAYPINENFLKQMDSRGSQIERGHKEFPSDPVYSLFTQLGQGVLEAATGLARNEDVDSMLYLPARTIASPNTTLALKSLHNHNRSLFGTIMQVFGFMRGTRFMVELADALIASDNPVTQMGDTSLQHSNIVQSDWTSTMLHDQTIVNAAAFKDTATAASLLNHIPTVLQLACAARSVCVVEYLLSLGHPLIPLDWKVHPFILATKRRCRPILELFFKLAKDTVPQLIKNLSLAMVVNQDCALSEYWLDADQNDNKRIGEDVNIVSFLLANGASPNGKDQYGTSVLSMAIQAAYSLNPLSIQIVDILLHKGADFGFQEAELMFMAPPKAFELIIRRHKLRRPLRSGLYIESRA